MAAFRCDGRRTCAAVLLVAVMSTVCPAMAGPPAAALSFGPPVPVGGGGKMSNILDLYPDGFGSDMGRHPVVSSDGARAFQHVTWNTSANISWTSFAQYTNATTGRRWCHNMGTHGEIISAPNKTSFTSFATRSYEFVDGNMTQAVGPPTTWTGLPDPVCIRSGNKAAPGGYFTPYASGHIVLASGTHLQTGMYITCNPRHSQNIAMFRSAKGDGYNYEFLSYVAQSKDIPFSSEGPNEHDVALLGNGEVLAVYRTGAGDGNGRYSPYYRTTSKDGGTTWSTPVPVVDLAGNAAGCARPHLVALDNNVTLLSGGRMMMGRDYSRSFSIWASTDNGVTWARSDGSFHHNLNANVTRAPRWPADVNRTGWRFQYTSGYVGLVRTGPTAAAVLYDYMPPATPPPAPPPNPRPAPPGPPAPCRIRIHHTLGCFNVSDWKAGAPGAVLPSYQAPQHGKVTVEGCAAACNRTKLPVAGVSAGSDCFCGTPADMGTPVAQARDRPKAECEVTPCSGNPGEKACGGPGRLLVYAYSCDRGSTGNGGDAGGQGNAKAWEQAAAVAASLSHGPSFSFSMHIDVET